MESPWGDRDWQYYTDYSELPLCILQLDPADRAVIRIADERDAVQKKTFTKWVNKHLLKAGRKILDLYEDLRDGHNLISLLEVLAHEILPRERGHMRFHKIQNVQIALDFLRMKGIKLVNIRSDEIVDGNPKLTLGLIWTIILHFQISDVVVPGQEDITAKDALLLWSRRTADGYPGVKIRDFSSSWRDGRAFLSILHRNRPDLVDIRHMRQSNNKQNLEAAFSIAEREFGVTRLLDVDDVDVPNPDEKSIITYVSSLYDVFPEVPSVEQSLKDNEKKLKVEEYREVALTLLSWIRDSIKLMLSRNYPTTLIEIKALQSDFNRFRSEDVPPRLEMRNRALRLFDEIQSLTSDPSQMNIEDEYLPHNVSRMWSRFEAAMQERDMTLQAEVIRLERLHRLAEKAQRDIRYNEETGADLGRRIDDTVRGLDMMHAFEAKRNCDALDRGLKSVEESLRGLFRDCQTLQDGSHPLAEQLFTRVTDLQAKVSSLRDSLHSQVMHPLLVRSTDDGQGRLTKSRAEVVSEGRLMDTEPAYRHLHDCLEWIDAKQRRLEGTKYDSDLSCVTEQLVVHRGEHEEILAFRSRIDRCISDRTQLSSEQQKLYTQKLSKVEVAYSLLSKTSSSRLRCLESLSEFLQLATTELVWLKEREETELSRDWGTKDMNFPELDEYHKSLVRQMESRESQFNAVQEKGGAMILDRHPSARTVEAYMSSLQSQWSWLVHLSWCLEAQLKHCAEHNSFFEEAHHCEQWMARHSELLQNRFSSDNIPLDQAQVLLADLQAIQDQIREYDRRVSALVVKSRDIIPLKLRSQRVTAPIRVRTLCACHQQDVSLQRGEECFLVNNSHRTKWKVKTTTSLEVDIPAVCILIPPPNQEAIDLASRLKLQQERLLSQWKTHQRKVRTAAISAVIKQIKGWDLKKFLAMEPAQRDAVWHALKEDGQKLIAECGTSDRDMRKLSEELKECQQIYLDLCQKAVAKEGKRSVSTAQVIMQRVDTASRELLQTEQQLSALLHRPLPQNNLAVQESFRSYRELQLKIDKQESDIRSLQTEVKELSPRNSNIESKLNLVVQKADQMKALSHIYVDRLKGCEVVIAGMNEVKQLVTDFESSLAAHDNMTSDLSELKSLKNELVGFQESLQHHQPKLQHLKEDVESLRILVGRTRPGTTKHHDVDSVEKEVNDLVKRWDQICIHVVERLRSVGSCQDLLSLYHNGLHTEQTWTSQMEKRISSQPSLNGDVKDIKQQLEPTMAIYNALGDRRYQIESVNRHGGQFIREAKISDKRLKQFKDNVSENSGLSEVPDSKKFRRQDGSDVVRDELDRLNKLYMEMVDWANTRLRQITDTMSARGEMQFQMVVDDEIPLLRTFRAELAKRSSMLVDADMREYFTQQFDGPTASQASYGSTPDQLYKSTLQIRPESAMAAEFAEVKKVILLQPKSQTTESQSDAWTDRTNSSDLLMTLKSMESLSTLVPSAAASSEAVGAKQQHKYHEQILVTVKKEEIAPRGQVLHITAILNPKTSQRVTLVEALQAGLIDLKTKTFLDASAGQRFSLSQAAKKGYMDEVVLKQLTSSCGSLDPQTGEELSLLEAIQKKLYDPITNTFTDATAGEQVSISEAVSRGIISESCSRILAGEPFEITSITRSQAVFTNSEPFRLDSGLSLGKILEKGLCSEITGKVTDPTSGTDMGIMEAVEKGYINPSYQEIKDPRSGNYITLTAAVAAGIVDPFKGTFNVKSSGQQLSLSAAWSQGLVRTATSLADVVAQGNLTENGQVFDTFSGKVITIAEAIETGVISSDKKCILDPITEKVLSVKEAISHGIMTPSALFVNPQDKTRHPILAALQLGIVKLVQEDIQFSRSGVKDPRTNEVVTMSEALKRNIITPQGSYVDTRTGREMNLQQAAKSGLVDRSLVRDLYKPTSMKDAHGRNVSIADALRLEIVDTETGSFENVRTGEKLTMQEATSIGLISSSDATNILSLLSPVMTTTTVLTQVESPQPTYSMTVSQAVAQGYLNQSTGFFKDPTTGQLVPLEEAIQKGLLKLSSEWPGPASLSSADGESGSELRKVLPETFMTDTSGGLARTIPIQPGSKMFESCHMTKRGSEFSYTSTALAKPLLMHPVISETREINLLSVLDPRTGREFDVENAVKRGLISLEQGEYTHPITGEKISLSRAIEKGFVKAEQMDGSQQGGAAIKDTRVFSIVGVLHPRTRKRLTVSQAVSDGILDQGKGIYNNVDDMGNPQPMKISEAIEKGYVIVEDIGDMTVGPDSMLRETKSYVLKSVLNPVTGKHMSIADAIAEGIIDESEGMYINPVTGTKIPIHSAIEQGLILAELTSVKTNVDRNVNKITTTKLTTLSVTAVVDPRSGKLITVSKAIEEGILNQTKGTYTDPQSGESMMLGDAIDKRLVLAESPEALSDDPMAMAEISSIHITDVQESHEATMIEDVHSETFTMSITNVVNPKTMKVISYEEAVDCGILNVRRGTYINPSSGDTMTITAALEKGLIHGEVTSMRREDDMRSSVSAAKPIKDVTSVIDPRTGKKISYDKAVKDGIINPDRGTYFNSRTNTEIDLSKARDSGYLLESKQSTVAQLEKSMEEENLLHAQLSAPRLPRETNKPWSKVDMELEKTVAHEEPMEDGYVATEVLHYSTDIENETSRKPQMLTGTATKSQSVDGISYIDGVKLGLVNPDTGRVRDPKSGKLVTLQEAIDKGVVNANLPAIEEPTSGQTLSLKESLEKSILSSGASKFDVGKAKQAGFSEESLPQRVECAKGNIIDIVSAGLFNPITGKFLEPTTGQQYSLQEGLDNNFIDGDMVTVRDTQTGERIPLASATKENLIDRISAEVNDTERRTALSLPLAIERHLVENRIDFEAGTLTDHNTGEQISLRKAILEGDLKSDSVAFLDTKTGEKVSLDVALTKGIVDKSGSVTDRQSGHKISPQEALKMGLMVIAGAPIMAGKMVVDAIRDRNSSATRTVGPSAELTGDTYELQKTSSRTVIGNIALPANSLSRSGQFTGNLQEISVTTVHVDGQKGPSSPTVGVIGKPVTITIDPGTPPAPTSPQKTGKSANLSFQQKLSSISDSQTDTSYMDDLEAQHTTEIPSGLTQKYHRVSHDSKHTVTTLERSGTESIASKTKTFRETSVRDLDINWEMGTVTDKLSSQRWTVKEAVQKGLINSDLGKDLTLTSTEQSYVNPDISIDWAHGQITDKFSKETFTIESALTRGLIDIPTASALVSISETATQLPRSHRQHATDSTQQYTLNKAIREGMFNPTTGEVIDPASGVRMSIKEALSKNIIDVVESSVTNPQTGQQLSLQSAIGFDPLKGELINIASRERISLQEADVQNLIPDQTKGGVHSHKSMTSEPLTVLEAIKHGYLNEDLGTFTDPETGKTMPISAAVESGLISSSSVTSASRDSCDRPGLSQTQVLEEGLFDEQTGIFYDLNANEDMSFQEAVDIGRIDGKLKVFDVKSGDTFTLDEALKEGKIDPVTGKYIDEESGSKMTLKEAARLGILAAVGAPIMAAIAAKESLSALRRDNKSKDSSSGKAGDDGKSLTSAKTLEAGRKTNRSQDFTNTNSISDKIQSVIDPATKKEISASQAVEKGILDAQSGTLINTRTGEAITIDDSLKQGAMKGTEASLKSIKVVHESTEGYSREEFDSDKVYGMPQNEFIRRGLVDSNKETYHVSERDDKPFAKEGHRGITSQEVVNKSKTVDKKVNDIVSVYDLVREDYVSASEAVASGLLDLKSNTYRDPASLETVPLSQAIADGFVIRRAQESLEEANERGHTEEHSAVFSDPITGIQMSVKEAMKKGILDSSGKYIDSSTDVVSIDEVNKRGLVSDKVKKTSQSNSTVDQHRVGEAVTFHDAMKLGLINPNTGTYVDAFSQKEYSVDEAVRSAMIVASDGKPFEYKGISEAGVTYSFRSALQTGIIDSTTCLFYDNLTGNSISIEAALEEGYLSPIAGSYGGRVIGESVILLTEGVAPSAASSLEEIIDSKTGEKLSLSEAEKRGLVSVVRSDNKLMLNEAIQSGLVDSDTGLFHDPVSGDRMPIDQAVLHGIIDIDDRESHITENGYHHVSGTESMNIASAINQGYLDTATGTFTDPHSHQALTVSQAIHKGLLKPTLSVEEPDERYTALKEGSRDSSSRLERLREVTSRTTQDKLLPDHGLSSDPTQSEKNIKTTRQRSSIQHDGQPYNSERESTDRPSSYETVSSSGRRTPLEHSISRDRSSTPVSPGRMADSYDKLVQDISAELQRLHNFELVLKEDAQMGDEVIKIQHQIEAQKNLHDEILNYQHPILSLVYQAEQLTELYQEELTPEQVTFLAGEAAALKKALEKVVKTSDRRLKHLKNAAEELSKLEAEADKFNSWKTSARNELTRQEQCLQRFEDLKSIQENQKELLTDIISHQADIRFMSMSVQKYIEEAKLHKLEVDSFRVDRQRPARSSLISMDCVAADSVKDKLKDISDDYTDLKHKCSSFGDLLSELSTKQRGFDDSALKMLSWLADTEDELSSIKQESGTPDPNKLHGQLDRIKSLSSEVLSQSGLMDDVRKKGHDLTNSLSGVEADRNQVEKVEKNVEEIDARYTIINKAVSAQVKLLQATITQSQDIQGAISDIQARLKSAQIALSSQQPISLELPLIAGQEQQLRLIAADVSSYGDSLESIRHATHDLIKAGDLQVARTLEQQLADIETQFEKIQETCDERADALRDISGKLETFHDKLSTTQNWFQTTADDVNSSDFNTLPVDEALQQLAVISKDKIRNEKEIAELKKLAKELSEDSRTGSPASINRTISELQKTASQFDEAVNEKQTDITQREKQANEFEAAKTIILLWLAQMEARVDEFDPAAMEVNIVEKQIAELQPMLIEYEEHGPKIDEVNDLGNALEVLTSSGDRPLSPIRRFGRPHRVIGMMSPHLRSPSPTFPLSPTALKTSMSSESSGVSSRKSSSDNILLDDLSHTQQQMLDINQRYEILGERLADRQQELQNILASIRMFLQDMQDVLSWLDVKDSELSTKAAGGIPAYEKEAKKKLKAHEEFHRELLNREGLVEDIRKKAQELLKSKPGVPGLDTLQSQLTDLDEKWHGLRALSEEYRKGLEDAVSNLRDFREHEDQLSKWFGQKEKLLDVLGPVAMEPSLLRSQMEQVKVLKEEFASQEPTYGQFIRTGHTILDWCDASSSDSSVISKRMDAISKSWNKLQGRLKEREKNIESVQGLSGEFSGVTRELANWLGDFNDRIDSLPKVSSQADKQHAQKLEMQKLQEEMQNKLPEIAKAKDLCLQLCDTTKDLSTKTDLKAKMAALDKDITDTLKKLESRVEAIEEASKAGEEFNTKCQQMLDWIQTTTSNITDAPPFTNDPDQLQMQVVDTKAMRQDLSLKEMEVRSLLDKGSKFIHEASPSAETKAFKDTLVQLENEWVELKDAVKEREDKIRAASSHAQDFQQNLGKISWWLGTAEERLKKITPESLDKASIAAKLKELQSLQNEFLKKSHDHDNFNKTADCLLNAVDDLDGELKGQVNEVNGRWDALSSGLSERTQSLEDLQSRLAEIEDNKTDARHSLTRWEDKLAAHMDMGTAARDPKHLDKVKAMQDDISAIQSQLDYLDKLVEGLQLSQEIDSTDLENELKGLRVRHDQLQSEVGELISNMEAGSSIVGQFQDMLKKVASQLSELDNDLSNMKPVSHDEHQLSAQLQEIRKFNSKLSKESEPLTDVKEQSRDLQLAGFVSDPDGLSAQVESLLNQHSRLKDRTDHRLSEIEANREKVDKISDTLKDLRRKIDDAVGNIDSMKPVGSSASQIKEQQEELKKFSKSKVEPLLKELNSLKFDIEALMKSAPSGISIGSIEEDLEVLQEAWSELSDKVSERERNLDKALLQSGKFKEAFASLLSWMDETEEAVANQKSASPEFRVVKAQLQEQKLLQKMIDDRAPSVASVTDTGQQLLSGLKGAEFTKLETELNSLDKRWTALTSNVTDRMKTLEETSELAKLFQDIHEPLSVWLEVTDKKFASWEPKSPNAGGIEKLVSDLKQMQATITEREASVKELAALGKQLQDFCKGEDVTIVQLKIDDIQKQFSDLKNKIDDSLEQMEEALPLAHNFQDAHEKFVEWVTNVESELRGKETGGEDAEEKVEVLLEQLEAVQPYLDIINNEGAELAEVAPGDAGVRVEEMISKDNKRYDGVRQQIEKRAEKVKMARQRSLECINELDELLDWFDKGEDKLNNLPAISAEPGRLQKQLADIKAFSDEVSNQKVKVRDTITSGKKLLRDSGQGDVTSLQDKIHQLKNKSQTVGSIVAEKLSGFEQALPLAKSFTETHDNLVTWLDEVESNLADLEITAVDANQVRKQQESIKALKKDVADHKPVVDRLNKAGSALVQLVSPNAAKDVQNKLNDDNKRVEDVRNGVRERSNSIDAAMQQSAEFTDKLEDMLETLTTTAETIHNTEPISSHPGKIREQIEENKIIHEDMQMKSDAFESVKEAAGELIKQAGDASDPAVRDVRQKLEELTRLYGDIQNNCHDRSRALDDALGVSEKFWEDLNTLSGNIKELQEGLNNQEKPALEPEAIREQQEELEAFRDDLATTQADLEELQETGDQLMSLVGDPERPEVQKNLNDTEESLQCINSQVEQRSKDLDVALSKAITFQEELQKLLVWLQTQEDTISMMEPVASDLETITAQWNDIKVFKGVIDPKHVEVEALNQQAEELAKDCTAEKAAVVIEPVREVNQRWDALQANIGDRQKDIQMALLSMGHFDQAYKDFRSWLNNVDTALDELEPLYGDLKIVEMELANLRVINNDISAHQDSLDLLSKEANKIVAKEKAPEANKLKKKMENLVQDWDKVKEKAAKKQSQLDAARREARGFTEELQRIAMKISDLDGQLITSQPVGGLPETAKEQLHKFMGVYEEVEKLEPGVESLQLMSEKLASKTSGEPASSIRHNMANLHHRWTQAMNRAADRKKKLEDAVGLAGNFNEELNKFIGWLTDTEKTLNNLQPVSRLVDRVTKQIEDHRILQKDVSGHRESMFALDKMGTHLKYFSQKQDIVLIKNLLSSAQHRWEKIVSRSAERTRHLERGYKEAKQFYDSWKDLIQWLTEAEQALNSENSVSNEPEKIKAQIAKHKEFQRRLGAKQPVYDSINRAGSTLQNRCPADDKPAIQALLADLKGRWNAVCGRSVDRQRKLEEGLLFTGQFSEALETLLEWLAKVEPTLAEDTQVHGDLDTVVGFLEAHKGFQQELGAKATTVQFVRKSAKEMIEKSSEDVSQVQSQLIELSTMWDRTCKLSVNKQERLDQAYMLADEFHNKAQGLLDWLANAERQLRFRGPIPDEEAVIMQQIEDHKTFEESMLREEAALRETLNIGQDIMKRCHPDAVTTMKHWLGVLRVRWEELMGLSRQRQKRLTEALSNARLNNTLLEEMLVWLNSAEVKLTDANREIIPKDLQIIQDLIAQHQDFQNEMSSKQPSVDRLTKADKRKAGSDSGSHIPVFRGARNVSKSKIPTIRVDRVDSAGRKTPDFFGRKTPDNLSGHRTPSGRKTPDVSGRRTPDHSGRRTPDYISGRRTPDHSGRRTPEPGFHNPRVGALFNKWRHVWLLAMYRQRKLQDALDYLSEVERLKNFDFEEWRKRYLRWMNHNKARIMDFFRRQDRDRDGRVTRQEFIDGILQSKFPTSRLEMETVADIFDKDGDGFINYKEFVAALRPDRDPKPETDSEKIMDEVRRQVSKCTCVKQFKIHKIGEGKYRFGDSQKLRLVRILRSTVMVRVGGGWIALDEFLVKNDPCRVGLWRRKQFRLKRRYLHQNTEESKGRTNIELREQFILAAGVSQSMTGFVPKSPAGSSHSSGSSYSGKSSGGPITKIREKTVHQTPWRQTTKTSPDGEVHQIMSHTEPDGTKIVKHKVTQDLRSPRTITSPASRSSSRASTGSGSRPTSRTGSEAPDDNQEIFTTVQTDKQNIGGRSDTTVTYQTHNVQTRNVTLPTVTSTKLSRIPKVSQAKKK